MLSDSESIVCVERHRPAQVVLQGQSRTSAHIAHKTRRERSQLPIDVSSIDRCSRVCRSGHQARDSRKKMCGQLVRMFMFGNSSLAHSPSFSTKSPSQSARSNPESGLTLFAHSGTSSYTFGIRVIPSQSSAFGKTPLGVSSLIRLLNDWHMR